MGIEEQAEERQVLDSIFPDEITDISDTSYRIAITLDNVATNGEDMIQPTMLLTVTYPKSYPDAAPHLELSSPPNAPKNVDLDISNDRSRLLSEIQSTVDENIGMAMVFTIVSALKEAAESLIAERQAAAQTVRDIEAAKAEEEENRKFHGTAVTVARFMEWRTKFKREMEEMEEKKREEKEAEDKRKRVKIEDKLTGKQLWEQGLVGKVEDEEEDEGEDALKNVRALQINE